MSFYSADALPRAITDLEGVLCAGGVLTLFGRGTAARLAIVLGAPPPEIEVPPEIEIPPGIEVPDDVERPDGLEVPDDEQAAPPPEPLRDHRDPPVVDQPAGEPRRPDDQAADWDEGIDEIPDDDLPVRDDGAADPEHEAPGHPDPERPATPGRAHTRRRDP